MMKYQHIKCDTTNSNRQTLCNSGCQLMSISNRQTLCNSGCQLMSINQYIFIATYHIKLKKYTCTWNEAWC